LETLLLIGAIAFGVWFFNRSPRTSSETPEPSNRSQGSRTAQQAPASKPSNTYRPVKTRSSPSIKFGTQSSKAVDQQDDLSGLHDAFTGIPLNKSLGLYQCGKCKVYYHTQSFHILQQENRSCCVACGAHALQALTQWHTASDRGRDHSPVIVSLADFAQHFGRVVTFEGRVRSVKTSRRGTDYAVMFEDTSWAKGLKLVFFRGAISEVGGPTYIQNLTSRTVRVRGLLVKHPQFGPQIVISEKSMILRVT
jgi:hypothetical protein